MAKWQLYILWLQHGVFAYNDGTFNHILKFAYIPTPRVTLQPLSACSRNTLYRAVVSGGKSMNELLGQGCNIPSALAQGGQVQVEPSFMR